VGPGGAPMILRVATARHMAAATASGQRDEGAFSGTSTQVRPLADPRNTRILAQDGVPCGANAVTEQQEAGVCGGGRPGSRNASTAKSSVSRGSPAVRRDGIKRGPCQARRRGTMSAAGRGESSAATSAQPPIARPNGTNPWAITIPCRMARRHLSEWTAGGPDWRGRDVRAR
jgi:hypothetical protein